MTLSLLPILTDKFVQQCTPIPNLPIACVLECTLHKGSGQCGGFCMHGVDGWQFPLRCRPAWQTNHALNKTQSSSTKNGSVKPLLKEIKWHSGGTEQFRWIYWMSCTKAEESSNREVPHRNILKRTPRIVLVFPARTSNAPTHVTKK